MYPFTYHRPDSVSAAAKLAADAEAKIMAGGMTLLPTMKQRLASPSALIDLNAIYGDLSGISIAGDKVTIGAMTRHADVATSEALRKAIPALADLAGMIGDPMVRHRGTIGGSVANNDPAADYPSACLALGATIVTNMREIAADDFFTGLFETALEPAEIITKIIFPVPQKAAYQKFRNPASRYAIVGVFVAKFANGVRVAVTGAGSEGVFRQKDFEAALSKDFSANAIAGIQQSAGALNSDIHADAEYRAHLINVMARRAVEAAK